MTKKIQKAHGAKMKVTRNMMDKAIEAKIITKKQANNLIDFFKNLPNQSPGFTLTNVLYYFGGLIAIAAMAIFMSVSWNLYGGWAIFYISMAYALLGLGLTHQLDVKGYRIPAGICATFVICLTPLIIYSFQRGMGWWPDDTVYENYHTSIRWHWWYMEFGTLIAGVILAWFYRYPFMIMPIAVTLWYMSMDMTYMFTEQSYYNYELGAMVSMYFGIITLCIAFWVDIRSSQSADYAFWLYIFGIMAFWGGLTCQHSNSELSKFFYMCINLTLILIGVILSRKVFVLFGALGFFIYVSHLAFRVFQDSYLFPIILTAIGFAIIYLGILFQKNNTQITDGIRSIVPKPLKDLLDARDL